MVEPGRFELTTPRFQACALRAELRARLAISAARIADE